MPHLRITFIKNSAMAACLVLATVALSACASTPKTAAIADFSGSWYVKWCDRTNPKLDCGGFDISVVQEGNRMCGDFGGALVNLRQIDDGTLIGTAVGNTAVLAVQSNRNGAIHLVRAELQGDALKWEEVDLIRKADNNDILVIATSDVLRRSEPPTEGRPSPSLNRTCRDVTTR
ncbi:hypothetical protein [Stenotrophomonas oahuensis]|uniref:Lipocalin-like domain-containing protein n=1 Tax=Stenotrophomonas oahuensis TaxID=3003271 RepID=A0ABY9YKD4_9GAMM|nr:hypothetical protein [Stenotrophomonas sp. A5586]WNH51349.1 hypothetical protein PDM29_13365 [Stenotrophomonas sp. A5586]